jgi:hypothetical protein
MSAELLTAGLAALVSLASIGIAVTLWVASARLSNELADLRDETTKVWQVLEHRLAALERLEEPSRPAAAGSTTLKGSMQESDHSRLAQVRQAGDPPRHSPDPLVHVSQDDVRPTSPPQFPSMEQFLEEAAGALASAAAFNAFAARFRGNGYLLEEGSPSALPIDATPDRADLHVLTFSDGRLVVPGFKLRRAQGLLTSDEGRAAEAKLGWLFEIEQGQDMRATRGAIVDRDGWTVRRKGRLIVPL